MAKKRRIVRRRASPIFSRKLRRRSSSTRSTNLVPKVLGAMVYGAGRGYISNLIAPLTSKIPLGGFSDELGMGILSYYAAKGKFGSQLKEVGTAGLYIESAMTGQQLFRGVTQGNLLSIQNM